MFVAAFVAAAPALAGPRFPETGGNGTSGPLPLERSRYTMGTIALVRIEALDRRQAPGTGAQAEGDEELAAAAAAERALDALDEVDRSASLYKPESDLNRINATAGRGAVSTGPIVGALIDESLRLARLTAGAFDPTIKPLMDQLGFYREIGSEADPKGLENALRRVGWKKITFDTKAGTVRYRRAGMAMDFGGIGKGFALDRAGESLKKDGVSRAQIELGRSHLLLGRGTEEDGLFRLGVAAPDENGEERVRAVIRVPAGSIATSSPRAQTRSVDGRVVGHIVDPRRGPLDTPVLSATVWAPKGTDADGLAKAIVVQGPRVLKSLARRARFEALIVLADRMVATPGLVWEALPAGEEAPAPDAEEGAPLP